MDGHDHRPDYHLQRSKELLEHAQECVDSARFEEAGFAFQAANVHAILATIRPR